MMKRSSKIVLPCLEEGCNTAFIVHGMENKRIPAFFLPHGAPPLPIEPCVSGTWLSELASTLPKPKAIVFMSPHHYEDVFTVSSGSRPATMYDFDDDTKPEPLEKLCKLTYPCPGAPELASRVADLIRGCGFPCREDAERGLDHGIWTCLFLLFPAADIPVVSLSVRRDLDVEAHIRVGRALSNLRGENILLLGSGEVVHNVPLMGARSSSPQPWCLSFECWLEALMGSEAGRDRDVAFTTFRSAPGADIAHPPSSPGEHLMPWFFAFGAGGSQARGTCVSREYLGSLPMSAYAFEEL